jgi:leader peptidase (prepilin peptidase)/N-methyltransferase
MQLWFYVLMGWVMGSFCGAYIHRWPQGQSMLKPLFSHCPSCGKAIPFYHNIPVLSYIWLKGRSACCQTPISIDYFLIELCSLIFFPAFLYPFHQASAWIQLQWSVFFYFLLVQTFIDLRHRLIPDQISLGGTLLGIAFSFAYGEYATDFLVNRCFGALVGFGSLWLIAKLYMLQTQREGLGMGDMKLLMMAGSFLGFLAVFYVIFISSVIGLIYGIGVMIAKRSTSLQTAIPFGPSIALASYFIYLLSIYGKFPG